MPAVVIAARALMPAKVADQYSGSMPVITAEESVRYQDVSALLERCR